MALRDLVEGMSGEDVRALQQGLNAYFGDSREALVPDGKFGTNTRAALDAFQSANPGTGNPDGTPDGVAGRRTRRKLFPLAVYTVSAVAYRPWQPPLDSDDPMYRLYLRSRRLHLGPSQPPGQPQQPRLTLNPGANTLQVDWAKVMQNSQINYTPQRFLNLSVPLVTPPIMMAPPTYLNFDPPPSPNDPQAPPSSWFNFADLDHFELTPGTQTIVTRPSQTSFTLGLQGVAVIGDDDGAHQEFAMGTQLGSPNIDGSGDWSVLWYAQITDVDRFGSLKFFHWWQPYAQLGLQNTPGSFRPVITGNLFPINLGFDINKTLTVNVAGGLALSYDPNTGILQRGFQGTTGLIVKFGGSK